MVAVFSSAILAAFAGYLASRFLPEGGRRKVLVWAIGAVVVVCATNFALQTPIRSTTDDNWSFWREVSDNMYNQGVGGVKGFVVRWTGMFAAFASFTLAFVLARAPSPQFAERQP